MRITGDSLAARFSAKWHLDPSTGCKLWTAFTKPDGYGMIRANVDGVSRNVGAHRVAWALRHDNEVPDGQSVLHRCDTPACVNVEHLFLGTQADNVADMLAKGRRASTGGEHNGRAKLTEEEAKAILALYGTASSTAIAEQFGVGKSTVAYIWSGERWFHLQEAA